MDTKTQFQIITLVMLGLSIYYSFKGKAGHFLMAFMLTMLLADKTNHL